MASGVRMSSGLARPPDRRISPRPSPSDPARQLEVPINTRDMPAFVGYVRSNACAIILIAL